MRHDDAEAILTLLRQHPRGVRPREILAALTHARGRQWPLKPPADIARRLVHPFVEHGLAAVDQLGNYCLTPLGRELNCVPINRMGTGRARWGR